MIIGKKYIVFYFDGDRVRSKILIFKGEIANGLEFFNPKDNKYESIPLHRWVRSVEADDNETG